MSIKQILQRKIVVYRPLMISVLATALVWFAASMSDVKNYPATVHVEYVGYDTARFAIVSADSIVNLNIASNGFHAFSRSFSIAQQHITVNIGSMVSKIDLAQETMQYNLSAAEVSRVAEEQLDLPGVSSMSARDRELHITMAQRRRRAYVPQVKNVTFVFASGYGIYGEPRVSPDTVYLYGSLSSLAQIKSITTDSATITDINKSGFYRLNLDPIWKRYPDVRPSTDQVQVFLPVGTFTEKTFTVPIHFQSDDTTFKVRLYPETVEVAFWVPTKDFAKVKVSDFGAMVHYNPNSVDTHLDITMNRFPEYVRIKSLKPNRVQFVIIK